MHFQRFNEGTNKTLTRSAKRAIAGSSILLVLLIALGAFSIISVVSKQNRTTVILALANEQMELWRQIGSVVSLQVVSSGQSDNTGYKVRQQNHLIRSLFDKIELNQQELDLKLERRWFDFGAGPSYPLAAPDSSLKDAFDIMSSLVSLDIEGSNLSEILFDSNFGIMVHSQAHFAPIKQTIDIAAAEAKSQLAITFIIVLTTASVLIIATVVLQKKLITPAFSKLVRDGHQERLETLGRVSGGVAHDFNNTLATIVSRAELILRPDDKAADIDDIHEQALGIVEVVERAKSLVSQLLSYSRKQNLNNKVVSMPRMAQAISRLPITPSHIDFEVSCSTDKSCNLDADFFIRAIENILINAVHALGQSRGHIRLTILDGDNGTDSVSILVQDSGPGFPPEVLDRATEPFFTTKGSSGGSGLGLAMVSGFVEQSGGKLEISNDGKGGAVKMTFPIAKENPTFTQEKRKEKGKIGQLTPQTCIIVEDNIQLASAQGTYLKRTFRKVEILGSLKEAKLKIPKMENIDVGIFDWNLPEGNSEEVVREFCRINPAAVTIVTSGNVDWHLNEIAAELGFQVYEKPLRLSELVQACVGERVETS